MTDRLRDCRSARNGSILTCAMVVAAVATATPAVSHAQNAAEAAQHYERGRTLYSAGQFREAVQELLQAHRMSGDPNLLYNIARCYESLGDMRQAVAYYRAYLDQASGIQDRGAIETRIRNFEQRTAAEEAAERAAREAREHPAAPPPGPRRFRSWPWIILAVGALTLGGGATEGFIALSKDAQSRQDSVNQVEAVQLRAEAESAAGIADILFVAGGVVAGGGLILAFLNSPTEAAPAPSSTPAVTLVPVVAPLVGGAAFAVVGRF